MQRDRAVTAPAPLRTFPKVSLFTRVARTRRVSARHSGCAPRRTFSEFIPMSFQSLGLSQPVLQALALKEYTPCDPDPAAGHPDRAEGPRPARHRPDRHRQDRRLHAALDRPAARRPTAAPGPRACRMLVLAPTRELASQIAESARAYGHFSQMRVATVFGGTSVGKNRQDVARGVDVLVATPGRLIDLIEQRYLTLARGRDPRPRRGRPDARPRLHPRAEADRPAAAGQAPDPVLLGDHAQDDQGAGRQVPDRSGPGLGRARGDHGRAGRPICHLRPAGGEAGVADDDAAPRLLRARQYGPRADLHPHQARRRPRREAARRQRHRRQRHPRQQEPAAARAALWPSSRAARPRSWSPPTSPRAASTCRASPTSSISSCPTSPSNMSTASGGRRAPARRASPSPSAPTTRRAYLKDIEKLTRQRIAVEPLPANFVAEAHRIKTTRTAPPPPSREERREEEQARRRFPPQRAQRGRGRYASAVKPMGGGRRRAPGAGMGTAAATVPRLALGACPARGTPLRRGLRLAANPFSMSSQAQEE